MNESGYRFICAIEVTSETSGRPHTYLAKEADDRKKGDPWQLQADGRTEVDKVVQRVNQEIAGCPGPDETKPNMEGANKSIEEMIRKTRRCSYP